MCGVFGFVSTNDKPIPLHIIQRIAVATEKRGPHAFGFSWLDDQNRIHSFRQSGRISDYLAVLRMAERARMLIGHCRWATHGDPFDNINNHPHPCDGGWMVHNGVIHNHASLASEYELTPNSDCDSEILALLIEEMEGDRVERCIRATSLAEPYSLVMLGLWSRPGKLVALRRGNPLHISRTKAGYFLASRKAGMPGTVKEVRDCSTIQFSVRKGETKAVLCPF